MRVCACAYARVRVGGRRGRSQGPHCLRIVPPPLFTLVPIVLVTFKL